MRDKVKSQLRKWLKTVVLAVNAILLIALGVYVGIYMFVWSYVQ